MDSDPVEWGFAGRCGCSWRLGPFSLSSFPFSFFHFFLAESGLSKVGSLSAHAFKCRSVAQFTSYSVNATIGIPHVIISCLSCDFTLSQFQLLLSKFPQTENKTSDVSTPNESKTWFSDFCRFPRVRMRAKVGASRLQLPSRLILGFSYFLLFISDLHLLSPRADGDDVFLMTSAAKPRA